MQISIEQIREIAPDENSMAAAAKLLSPQLWQTGMSEAAIWGLCGGGRHYQISVDFADMGYRCNCPSRKFPCKHVLALLMLFASTPDKFTLGVAPDWVEQWLDKRKANRDKKARQNAEPAKPVDKAAQAKRVEAREQNVAAGIDQFIHWLDDMIRSGIAALDGKPYSFWDTQARRLVDAQAKGLANRVRSLAEIPGSAPDWTDRLLRELGKLRLLVQAYQGLDNLSPALQADVRQLIGWTVSQAQLEEHGVKVTDNWFVWGQRYEEDDRFRTQRSWAIGVKSQQEALILQFAPGKQGFPESIIPGTLQRGELLFYPGVIPQRAKFNHRDETSESLPNLPANKSISDFLGTYSERLALNPWLGSCGCLLSNVTLAHHQNKWWIRDESGDALLCWLQKPFVLLSQTGGNPFQLHAEWNGHTLAPLSYVFEGQFELC